MKRIGMIAAIGLFAAASAYAQVQYSPAVPSGLSDSGVPPGRQLGEPAASAPRSQVVEPTVPRLVMTPARPHHDSDARSCLQFTSNIQIARCAEKYRSHVRRASVIRTKAENSEVPIAASARAKATDLAKPDMSKAASPAKPVEMTKAAPSAKTVTAEKPAVAPKAAPPEKPAATDKTAQRQPKWTDSAKGIMKSQGDHLPD